MYNNDRRMRDELQGLRDKANDLELKMDRVTYLLWHFNYFLQRKLML